MEGYSSQSKNNIDISVIVLSYNTKDVTLCCINEISEALAEVKIGAQIIVVDNASTDGSAEELAEYKPKGVEYIFIKNDKNVGFSKGNNIGLQKATGRYILYLNSDVMVRKSQNPPNFAELVKKLDIDKSIAGLTVKVNLQSGLVDPASHRGFPTPLRSFFYFTGIEKILRKFQIPNSKFQKWLGGYHLLHLDLQTEHEIEACTAAFLLVSSEVVAELGGFDEEFFMYGEDLDMCYRIYEVGKKLLWFPKYDVTHLKYQSGIAAKSDDTKKMIKKAFYEAMWIFYCKHYKEKYGPAVTFITWTGINVLSFIKTGKGIGL